MNNESRTRNISNAVMDWIASIPVWIVEGIRNLPSVLSKNRMLVAIFAFFYLLPLGTAVGTSPLRAMLYIMTQIMIFGLLAMSFDLQLGRAGLLNFGHVALFGVGAYFMAFTLDASVLPPPLNLIASIPYPLTILLAMMVGAGLGFVMGLTTSRMKGTAFAFIALAIAMFIYNFFAGSPDISGGETGLGVSTPAILRTAPVYLLYVCLAFIFITGFFGMVVLYVKERTESIGLVLLSPVMIAFTGILLIFGVNILGPILVFVSFLMMIVLYWMERKASIEDPLQFSEKTSTQSGENGTVNSLTSSILPIAIMATALIGVFITFGTNIFEMVSLWIANSQTFYYTIPVQYYLVLTSVMIVYIFMKRLVVSPFGRMVVAVAQNEERAQALGYNSYFCKIVVVVISGAIAGLAGALYAPIIRTIDPTSALGVEISIDAMLYTIIGGIGTLLGPLLGAGVVVYSELNLTEFLRDVLGLPGELWLVGLGIVYVFIVLFLPMGIVGSIKNRAGFIREKLGKLKPSQFEFRIRDDDYWVFALLGIMGLFVSLLIFSL